MKCFGILLFYAVLLSVQGKVCEKYVKDLASREALFTQCTSNNAVPVTFCIKCDIEYSNFAGAYKNLTEGVAPKNISCKDYYFDKDRLNIIQRIYENLNGLWEKAYCSECFTHWNETVSILNAAIEFEGCIKKAGSPCVDCNGSYMNMNGMYNNLAEHCNGKICFDIQDKINRSRVTWSNELKCCKREHNLVAFTAFSCSLMVVPILFYATLTIITRRTERSHGVLDNTNGDENTTNIERNARNQNPRNNTTTEHSTILPTNIPSSSTAHRSSPKISTRKEENQSNLSESSDEENLKENSIKKRK